ncbi:MAG: hypothetical protein ACE5NG_07025 [bacterium]
MGQWHHIRVVLDFAKKTYDFYVDSEKVAVEEWQNASSSVWESHQTGGATQERPDICCAR